LYKLQQRQSSRPSPLNIIYIDIFVDTLYKWQLRLTRRNLWSA